MWSVNRKKPDGDREIKMSVKPLTIGELTAGIPVIQGGMGVGVSLSGLAGAVAAKGGIGIISTAQIGFREPDYHQNPHEANLRAVKKEIRRAKELAHGGIVGVNIMVATRHYEEYVRAAIEAGADVIISGAGLPVTLPEIAAGVPVPGNGRPVKLVPIVSSLKSANVIFRYWMKKYKYLPDMVVIEGPLAGGHLGFTEEQLRDIPGMHFEEEADRILEAAEAFGKEQGKEIPVVMAGGVYTGEEAGKWISRGLSGVQMATRFVTTEECDAHPAYKQAYIDAKEEDIVLVKSPVGMPGRAIRNTFLQKAGKGAIPHGKCHGCIKTCNPADTPYCITEALIRAVEGDVENGLLFCGSNACRSERMETVGTILDEVADALK